jgi:hypothetical protein
MESSEQKIDKLRPPDPMKPLLMDEHVFNFLNSFNLIPSRRRPRLLSLPEIEVLQ